MINKKLKRNLPEIINEYKLYFGKHNNEYIDEKVKKLRVVAVPNKSNKIDFFKGEPYCVKRDDKTFILVPESLFSDERGNPLFVHQLVRALSEDTFSIDGKDTFHSVFIDIITNDICKVMEEKNINLTDCEYPEYKSESFYSTLAKPLKAIYNGNKQKILDSMMKKNIRVTGAFEKAIDDLESKVSGFYDSKVEALEQYSLNLTNGRKH